MTVLLVVLYGGIVVVSLWGALTIPEDRRFGVSFGVPPAISGTLGKRTGLIWWLAMGTMVFTGSLLPNSEGSGIRAIAAGLLGFFLVIELYTVRRLRR